MAENVERNQNKLFIKNFNKDNKDNYQCKYGDNLEKSLTLTLIVKGKSKFKSNFLNII